MSGQGRGKPSGPLVWKAGWSGEVGGVLLLLLMSLKLSLSLSRRVSRWGGRYTVGAAVGDSVGLNVVVGAAVGPDVVVLVSVVSWGDDVEVGDGRDTGTAAPFRAAPKRKLASRPPYRCTPSLVHGFLLRVWLRRTSITDAAMSESITWRARAVRCGCVA